MATLDEINILANVSGHLKHLCRLTFKSDASLYFRLFGQQGQYYYGMSEIKEFAHTRSFDYAEQRAGEDLPHLSIHQSGRVHIRNAQRHAPEFQEAGPNQIPPLHSWSGEHLATITFDNLRCLPDFPEEPVHSAERQDFAIPADDLSLSGKLVFFLNGRESSFLHSPLNLKGTIKRGNHPPIYLGMLATAQPPIAEGHERGIIAITGWNPTLKEKKPKIPFIYLRAE